MKTKFDLKDTRIPTEHDLDEIYDTIQVLNKSEWFCTTQKDLTIIIKAQKILQKILEV